MRVVPRAKKERVTKEKEHQFYMEVKEPAERNLVNTRVRELIAREYGSTVGGVRIISGHRSPSKIISVETKL